jgi:ABC-type bacteriocin/lantibiotic exporter with double-glycine peptidase domain
MSATAGVLTQALDKMMQIAVLGIGAMDVFDGSLSIGALVTFNMISGRVTGPLVQVVGLINEYQEAALAVKMLGIVMLQRPERDPTVPACGRKYRAASSSIACRFGTPTRPLLRWRMYPSTLMKGRLLELSDVQGQARRPLPG